MLTNGRFRERFSIWIGENWEGEALSAPIICLSVINQSGGVRAEPSPPCGDCIAGRGRLCPTRRSQDAWSIDGCGRGFLVPVFACGIGSLRSARADHLFERINPVGCGRSLPLPVVIALRGGGGWADENGLSF